MEVVFSGGGALCIASYSCACELRRRGVFRDVRQIAGTSAGALSGVVFALETPPHAAVSMIAKTVAAREIASSLNLASLISEYGLVPSHVLRRVIAKVICECFALRCVALGRELPTAEPSFRDVVDVTGIDVHIYALDVAEQKPIVFSVDNSPLMSIVDAVTASCSVPFVFAPTKIQGKLYVDAGVTDNRPVNGFVGDSVLIAVTYGKNTSSSTSSFQKREKPPVNGIFDFGLRVISTVIKECNERGVREARRNQPLSVITIPVAEAEFVQTRAFSGTLTAEAIEALVSRGCEAADEHVLNLDPNFLEIRKCGS